MTLVNECGIATRPDAFSAKTEEYPLNRRMYLYNRSDDLNEPSQALLDFAVSEQADPVIIKSGFIDLGVVHRDQDATDARAASLAAEVAAHDAGYEAAVAPEMLDRMSDYDRLSTTFRFRTGSYRVDERGKLNMARLIDYLESAPQGTEVKLVGFTVSVGAFEANRRLSLGRAGAVLEEVRQIAGEQLGHVQMTTEGFGEVAPSACNVTDRGRSISRLVEVWISNDV